MTICLVLLLYGVIQGGRRRIDTRLRGIELQLDAITAHLGIAADPTIPPEVRGLMQAGRKIEAIKLYREATGAGLADAKAAVERLERLP